MAVIAQQSYKIDLTPQGGYVMVYVSQHDNEAREIVFKIHNQGKVFDIPANINVSVQGVKSNGGYFTHNCTYSGNLVTMPIANDMTDVIGKAVCVLKFTNASQKKLATAKFILNIDSDSSSEGIIIDTVAEEIFDQLMDEIRAQAAVFNVNIATLQSMVGTPLIATTAAGMTNHNKIYVYTGNETGYTYGDWYYWDDTEWQSGGQYNSVPIVVDQTPTSGSTNPVSSNGVYTSLGNKVDKVSGKGLSTEDYTTTEKTKLAGLTQVDIDDTLSVEGQAADAKKTGDKVTKIYDAIDYLADNFGKPIYLEWESGTLDSTTGEAAEGNAVRTAEYIEKADVGFWSVGPRSGALYVYRYTYENGNYTYLGRNQRTGNGVYTSWLKNLTGTHFRFTVGLKNATPNDWMTIYSATQLSKKIELFDNVISSTDIGLRTVEFTVNASASHSSLSHQINLSIEEGLYFYCIATGLRSRNVTVYVRNENTEVLLGSIAEGIVTKFKAPINIEKLGLFVSSGAEEVKINLTVFSDKSVLARLTGNAEYDKLFLTKLLNAKRKANHGRYENQTAPEIFTLTHFSDIHGSSWAMEQIQNFKDKYQAQIDDVICTGDIVADKISDGMDFWNNNSDGEILICIGNHDSLGNNGWENPVSQQVLYETYIEPYEENWGAETVNGHSYWYKDYTEKKIRLIAVDATIYDEIEQASQMTWLNTVLNGAITNGFAVICAIHFPPMPSNFQKINSNFTALLHNTGTDMLQFAWHTYHTDILGAIDQFIEDGGDFVCWLSGHTHWDVVSYDDRFPKQLFITISCAMPSGRFEERVRDRYRGSGLVLNTVCVDTNRKYVKLLRYGAEWDDCLRHTGSCVIKYDANPPEVMYQE